MYYILWHIMSACTQTNINGVKTYVASKFNSDDHVYRYQYIVMFDVFEV